MKIVSYNVNGIRAAMKKGLAEWMSEYDADVYCLQEIKANEEDIDKEVFEKLGYHTQFFSAQKKGYSGTGIISKKAMSKVEKGAGMEQADFEGRIIHGKIDDVYIVNTYFPSGSSGDLRQDYKMEFLSEYLPWAQKLRKKHKKLLILGDFNICHKAIDIHDPVRNKKSSGFLPEERDWMEDYFNLGFTDSLRYFNPHPHQYSWWSYRANARANNKGWRIDYISSSNKMDDALEDAGILSDVKHSDHCPIFLKLKEN